MTNSKKPKPLPFLKFYPESHLADPKQKLVSRAARSFLFDSRCLMTMAGEGYLLIHEKPPSVLQLARTLGDRRDTAGRLLNELLEVGCLEKDEHEVIFCPWVVESIKRARSAQAAGRKGGNPALIRNKKHNRFNN